VSNQVEPGALSTTELLELVMEDLYDGYSEGVVESVTEILARGLEPYQVLTNGLIAGMDIVGKDFRDGELFVPEVLMASRAMKAGLEKLRPQLAKTNAPKLGKIVIGTVKGDIHDIGKSLVSMMMEGAGFEVVDLGVNNSVDDYIAAIQEHRPNILGMSALLTTTSPYMGLVVDALTKEKLRNNLVVLVGGAPLNGALSAEIGADAYCRDAFSAVETAKQYLGVKPSV